MPQASRAAHPSRQKTRHSSGSHVSGAPGSQTASGGPLVGIIPLTVAPGAPDYMGCTIAHGIALRLARAGAAVARVAAPESVLALAGRGLSAQQICAAMEASFVLSGAVSVMPPYLRVRLEMTAASGGQLWSEDRLIEGRQMAQASRELAERALARIAGKTLKDGALPAYALPDHALPENAVPDKAFLNERHNQALSVMASAELRPHAPERYELPIPEAGMDTESASRRREAWELLECARYEWRALERHRMQDAVQRLTRAIEIDPELVDARVELVHLCTAQALCGYMPPAAAARLARRAAPGLDANANQEMEFALVWIRFFADRDLKAVLDEFGGLAHLPEDRPHDAWTTNLRALFALSRRRFAEAIELLKTALRLDPWSALLHARLAWALHLAGEAEASVTEAERALREFPAEEAPAFHGALILAANSEAARAVKIARELARQRPYFDAAQGVLANALARDGQREQAREVLNHLRWLGRERYVMNTFTPAAWVALAEPEMALEALRAAEHARCPWFFQMLADPQLAPLRAHREFQEMEAIGAGMEASLPDSK